MARSNQALQAVENIASISEENSAAAEEVSASTEEMSAQVEELASSAQSLNEMAEELRRTTNHFKLPEQTGHFVPARPLNGKHNGSRHSY